MPPSKDVPSLLADLNARLEGVEGQLLRMWTIVDKVRDRIPVWATCVFALLTGIIGWCSAVILK